MRPTFFIDVIFEAFYGPLQNVPETRHDSVVKNLVVSSCCKFAMTKEVSLTLGNKTKLFTNRFSHLFKEFGTQSLAYHLCIPSPCPRNCQAFRPSGSGGVTGGRWGVEARRRGEWGSMGSIVGQSRQPKRMYQEGLPISLYPLYRTSMGPKAVSRAKPNPTILTYSEKLRGAFTTGT